MDLQQLKEREEKVIELAVSFCNEHLDEKCAALCTKLVQKLGDLRNQPLQTGRLEIWAAAAVYTICSVNLMLSNSANGGTTSDEICAFFGTSNSTVARKSRQIRDILKISRFHGGEFSLKNTAQSDSPNVLKLMKKFFFFLDDKP